MKRHSSTLILFRLRFNPVVDPMRVPPLDGIDGDAVEQQGEVQVAVE